ncbi:hypothetical protein [Streptomyces sp. NPDC097619]|uniref:hypothetical protein n=1 Tax=Streptomyces sp. NPDC097619 TaxID=3157228 RepID=UPI0033231F35
MSLGEGPTGPYAATPDWEALAEETARRDRRRRLLLRGGAAAAVGAVAVLVAVLLLGGGAPRDTAPAAGPAGSSPAAVPAFPSAPPGGPHPLEFLRDERRDRAPFTAAAVFPDRSTEIDDRTYRRTAADTTTGCAKAASPAVAAVLARHGCRSLVRATYQRKGVATTVGVLAFPDAGRAAGAKADLPGPLSALQPAKGPRACTAGTVCRRTANSYGRFVYVTLSGFQGGKGVTREDRSVYAAGDDLAEYAFQRILARGRSLAPASPAP